MNSAWAQKCMSLRKKEGETLADLLHVPMQNNPEKVVIYFEDQEITYRELEEAGNRIVQGLVVSGVSPGDRVAVSRFTWESCVPERSLYLQT